MRVLINAFAFSPYRGSECAVGWNIVNELAKLHGVTVIFGDVWSHRLSLREWNKYVEENEGQIKFKAIYVEPNWLIGFITCLHKIPGCWMLYYTAYKMWQKKAYKVARKLNEEKKFDVVHQLNMIGYREPGYMWKLGIPFVWGPVGGAPNEPLSFLGQFSFKGKVFVLVRTVLNEIQKRINFRAKKAARIAKKIWAVTDADYEMIHNIWGVECDRILECGVNELSSGIIHNYDGREKLRIVWSGLHISRKALPILIRAIAKIKRADEKIVDKISVEILGEGPDTRFWKQLAVDLGVEMCFKWIGRLCREEAITVMRNAHVLACTSIKEASSIVVIEAVQLGLPVICHNACGMGVVINDKCGIKVPLVEPNISVTGFADAIKRIIDNPDLVKEMSINALEREKELTWSAKVAIFSKAYKEIVK